MKAKCFGIICLILLLNVSLVNAFSVATLYSDNYPLRMKPGEIKETFFLVRNVIEGDSDVVIRSELTRGNEVASFVDEDLRYEVAFGEEIEVPIRVAIPEDAELGARYKVGAIFRPNPVELEGGNVQLVINIGKSFPIVVVGETGEISDEGETLVLTVEDDEGIVETLSPFAEKYKGILLVIIVFLVIGVIAMGAFIIYLLMRRRK